MYSNKENVNILTSLLVKYGVRHAVVCPGSRNAPIVHNLNECPDIRCVSVTDERSAGFYALGIAQYVGTPVSVCVTSGSALLNVLPAVAEAACQHVPIVVISADRPPQWIGQLDGQTLPQSDALFPFVKKVVSLPEPHDNEERWYCNRLTNEVLLEVRHHGCGPVHINVPLSEPLYAFSVEKLPDERIIGLIETTMNPVAVEQVRTRMATAVYPQVLVGLGVARELTPWVLATNRLADFLEKGKMPMPDFVLYLGGTLVSKRLKQLLRQSTVEVWAVSENGTVQDVFMHLTRVVEGDPVALLPLLPEPKPLKAGVQPVGYSPLLTVSLFEQRIADLSEAKDKNQGSVVQVHYANSTAIRLAAIYAMHHVWCNRGVNGIEGSLSTAAGMSIVASEQVFCVIGDLSFFYDQNALWNKHLQGNLRILLLNNGGGGIFDKFEGLRQSAACDSFIMAKHHTTAEGICRENGVAYRSIGSEKGLASAIDWLMTVEHDRPVLLEAFFD